MKNLENELKRIEQLCADRNRSEILPAIRALSKKGSNGSPALQIRKVEWLWRVGLHHEALSFAMSDPYSGKPVTVDAELFALPVEQLYWAARLYVSIGVWPYGARIAEKVKAKTSREISNRAMVLMTIGDFQAAFQEFSRVARPPAKENRWVIIQGMAQCGLFIGELDATLQYIDRGLEVVVSDADRWGLGCLRAITRVLMGHSEEGLAELKLAEKKLKNHPVVAPRWTAFVWLWKARALAVAGMKKEARQGFKKHRDFVDRGIEDYQPWRTLWRYDAMRITGLISEPELRQLELYPLNGLILPPRTHFETGPNNAEISIRLGADEYFVKGRCMHTIPIEIRLLAGLELAGPLGMNRELAKCWLWPDSLPIFFSLDQRLTQLERRLRQVHGFEISRNRETLWLTDRDRKRVSVDANPSTFPQFFSVDSARSPDGFSPAAVAEKYQLSPRMTSVILTSWMERGWIERTGNGRGTRYHLKVNGSGVQNPHSK